MHVMRGAEDWLWREAHVFHTAGEAIAEHVVYCSGHWDPAKIAKQAAEAPMVRR